MANKKPTELTDLQRRFINEYLIDLNVANAYKRARGLPKSNKATGSYMYHHPLVQAELKRIMKGRERMYEVSQDKVLKELIKIAFTDRTSLAKVVEEPKRHPNGEVVKDKEGNVVKEQRVKMTVTDMLTEGERGAIAGIKQGKHGIEVQTYDKIRALELLGKHLGMFDDRIKISGDIKQKVNVLSDILDQLEDK